MTRTFTGYRTMASNKNKVHRLGVVSHDWVPYQMVQQPPKYLITMLEDGGDKLIQLRRQVLHALLCMVHRK